MVRKSLKYIMSSLFLLGASAQLALAGSLPNNGYATPWHTFVNLYPKVMDFATNDHQIEDLKKIACDESKSMELRVQKAKDIATLYNIGVCDETSAKNSITAEMVNVMADRRASVMLDNANSVIPGDPVTYNVVAYWVYSDDERLLENSFYSNIYNIRLPLVVYRAFHKLYNIDINLPLDAPLAKKKSAVSKLTKIEAVLILSDAIYMQVSGAVVKIEK